MPTQGLIAAKQESVVRPAEGASAWRNALTRLLSWSVAAKVIYLGSDLFALTLAHWLALRTVQHFLRIPISAQNPFAYYRFYIPFFAVVLYLFEGYKHPELRRPEQELERSCKAVGVSFLGLVLFNFMAFRLQPFSRYMLVTWFCLALPLLLVLRSTLRAFYGALWKAGLCRRRALLIGSAAGIAEYRQLLSIQRHHGYEFMGGLLDSLKPGAASLSAPGLPVLGPMEEWEKAVTATGARVLVVASPSVPNGDKRLTELLQRAKERRLDVELYSCVLATANLNYEHDEFSGCFRFFSKPEWSQSLQRAMKQGMDRMIGLLGSVVALLLSPIVYVLVNLERRGPLFYRSAFVAQDGSTRYYLKFRTMHVDADQILVRDAALRARFQEKQKLIDDPRVTHVGRVLRKYSLDEIPQFFSILKGELSLVGPRTIRHEEAEHYGPLLGKLLSCKPGLTGFWQVMGRQTTTYEERVHMDMFYIDRWSIWLDIVIAAKTIWKVLRAEGAY
jgi:exopolysaccharide biosynthesis polyprenyl glycosylphosphotransferase